MKISFRRDLLDGGQGRDVFVPVSCGGLGCSIFSTLGVLSWRVRPRTDRQYLEME